MRSIAALAFALLAAACAAPANFNKSSASLQKQITQTCQRYEAQASPLARDCWIELADAQARNATANRRIQAVQPSAPYSPPLNLPVYSLSQPPSLDAPVMLTPIPVESHAEPEPVQTWGQTRCDVVIPPVMWDMPVTYRHSLIPAGC